MKSKRKIFFRADGDSKIGLGHIFRSLALAEMLCTEFDCHFIIRNALPTLKKQILEVCKSIIELPKSKEAEAEKLAKEVFSSQDIVVLDGYHFQTDYQRVIKQSGAKLVCIDDIFDYHFLADIIINHAGAASSTQYSAEAYTQFLLGLPYALLRKPFREASKEREEHTKGNAVFICLGGADPKNDTIKVIQKCKAYPEFDTIYVIVGAAYIYRKELEELVDTLPQKIEILQDLSADQMVACMQKCTIAITSPSTISYEYLSVGGILYLKMTADNQASINQYLLDTGLAFPFSDFPVREKEKIQKAQVLQREVFDGKQQKRMLNLFRALSLNIRRAKEEDVLQYYNWTNDPQTRLQSFNTEPIPLESHQSWFKSKLASTDCVLYVLALKKKQIGQIRFDFKEEVIISYSLDPQFRGQGYGLGILRIGLAQFKKEFNLVLPIVGFVKTNNIPSVKAFRSIGFKETVATTIEESFKYIL